MLLCFIKTFLQISPEFFLHFFGQLLCIGLSVFQQMFYIYSPGIGMFADYLIQMWLSKFRIVAFIVSVAAITNHINENIGIKFLAVTRRDLSTFDHRFRIVPVHMEDRRLDGCRQRGTII